MHYYQHHIGDFIKDTSFLTNEEVGIYLKLLWIYYDSEKPLPNNMFELSMKVNARDQMDALNGILEMFFSLEGDEWHHTRCDNEIDHYHRQLETASKAGKASAAKRALNKSSTTVQQTSNDRSTEVQPTSNQEPRTKNQVKSATKVAVPTGVDQQVWEDWLSLRKAKKAPVTQTVVYSAMAEAEKAGLELNDFFKIWCMRGSQGMSAEWIKPEEKAKFIGHKAFAGDI